jgi:predicted nucleic acid-binding protein
VGKLTTLIERKLIAFDSAPLIYYIEEHPKYLAIAEELFTAFANGVAEATTSVLTLQEVLVKPYRDNQPELAKEYASILTNSEHINLRVIDQAICEAAAMLRAKYEWLRTPDALQIASAVRSDAHLIVTNDDGWRRVKEINVAVLADFL